jgi:hypothetical protein
MNSLRSFGELLLQHVVNDSKTPLDSVIARFQEWDMEMQQKDDLLHKKEETYHDMHENPRQQAKMLYDQFISQQHEAALRYQNAPTKEKLDAFVRIRPPPELLEKGVSYDFVYTKNRA